MFQGCERYAAPANKMFTHVGNHRWKPTEGQALRAGDVETVEATGNIIICMVERLQAALKCAVN